jgi:hypothetical protein
LPQYELLLEQRFRWTYPFQPFNTNQKTQMDFSIRRDPGIPILQWLRGGPSVQIEIEAGANTVTLNADEDGLYVRAVGPSIENPSHSGGGLSWLRGAFGVSPLPLIGAVNGFVWTGSGASLVALSLFFVEASAFTFGSGLAIVPFLHAGLVEERG